MKSIAAPFLIAAVVLFSPKSLLAQSAKINCCGISLPVDSVSIGMESLYEKPIILSQHILKPITDSRSFLEIRQYGIQESYSDVIVIKCTGKSFSAVRYSQAVSVGNGLPPHTAFKPVGLLNNDPNLHILLAKKAIQSLKHDYQLKAFLEALASNNFFQMPGGDHLDKIVLASHPKILSEGTEPMVFEFKIGSKISRYVYRKRYDPQPADVKEYNTLIKINNLFLNLLQ